MCDVIKTYYDIAHNVIINPLKIVADTDVIVAPMRSPAGASAAILRAVRKQKVELLLSVPLAMEYEAVCLRPEHQMAAGLDEQQTQLFVDAAIAMAEADKNSFPLETAIARSFR